MNRNNSTSSRTRRSENSQSKIERINTEAKAILQQKNEELRQYEESINAAEQKLAKLQAELKEKNEMFENNNDSDSDVEGSEESGDDVNIDQLKTDLEAEIQKIKAAQEEELQNLQTNLAKALKQAEEWAESHSNSVAAEKQIELNELRGQLDALKASANESAFNMTQSRSRLHQQSKTISLQNAQRIHELEQQLSELAAITREELRDVRGKIDECFIAVDVREREHKNEIDRYQREIKQREEKYNTHLAALAEQYDNEKQRLDFQLKAITSKKANLEKVLAQLEKHHETQLQTTLKDIERMKSTIYQSQARDDQTLNDAKSYISQIQAMQRDCRHADQEITLINNEIKELTEENKQLQNELKRLDSSFNSRNSRAKRI